MNGREPYWAEEEDDAAWESCIFTGSVFVIAVLVAIALVATPSCRGAAWDAAVRIPSHGASATVIWTGPGETWILGCGHAYEGPDRYRPMTLNLPSPIPGAPAHVGVELVAVDYRRDLSLVLLHAGPVAFVAPVAPPGYRPTQHILSIGYDRMALPLNQGSRWAEMIFKTAILSVEEADGKKVTYTRENPVPGRSGGGLIDQDTGYLIGVCEGYEVDGPRRGMYIAHQEILEFLAAHGTVGAGQQSPQIASGGPQWPQIPHLPISFLPGRS